MNGEIDAVIARLASEGFDENAWAYLSAFGDAAYKRCLELRIRPLAEMTGRMTAVVSIFASRYIKDEAISTGLLSEKDFYLKTVKVFGKDISRAERIFRAHQRTDYRVDREQGFVQFSPECAQLLKKTDMQLGISYNIREFRERESVIRELRLDLEEAAEFRPEEL